ncbi:MAG: hypothetical protein A2270_01890 [Elusimicrobia bacterium RIFOXYA12_FULL_51_18]|nr:MAG: hypothetical protein A2270_01890 [Elusimicrobia bacterium RIFOXYA12_FULL_51_18]OGS32489.1 MAG: hypothetical protein A2218_03660 [Elusimicrobia bacterium RIFOXYA2_FULL_53_38]
MISDGGEGGAAGLVGFGLVGRKIVQSGRRRVFCTLRVRVLWGRRPGSSAGSAISALVFMIL